MKRLIGWCWFNKLFCWSCLLFSSEQSLWNKESYNLNNLTNAVIKHGQSRSHLCSPFQLARCRSVCIETKFDLQLRAVVVHHNDMVRKNRKILDLNDAVCFLAMKELHFREHKKNWGLVNKGNYVKLLNLLSVYDTTTKSRISKNI